MSKILLLVLFIFISLPSYADNIHSLQQELQTAQDTARVNILNRLSRAYVYTDINMLYKYAIAARTLAEKLHYKQGLSIALQNIGTYYVDIAQEKKGIAYFHLALKTAEATDFKTQASVLYNIARMESDFSKRLYYQNRALKLAEKTEYKSLLPILYRSIGITYYNVGDYDPAYNFFIKGLQYAETIHDTLAILGNLDGVGLILQNHQKKNSLDIYTKALKISEKLNHKFFICIFKNALASYYLYNEKPDTALIIAKQALKLALAEKNIEGTITSYSEIGFAYHLLNQNKKAIEYYNLALHSSSKLEEDSYTASILMRLGTAYLALGNMSMAIVTLKKAIAQGKKLNSKVALMDAYRHLSEAYEKQGNYKQAYILYKQYHQLNDSVFNISKTKEIASINNAYQLDKKEKSIKILKQDNDIKDLKIAKSNTHLLLLTGLCLSILSITALFYNRYRIKKRANLSMQRANIEIQSLVKEKDILMQEMHHRVKNNLQLISSLLTWQSESIKDPIAFTIIGEGRSRIKSIALIHESLYQSNNLIHISIRKYLITLLSYLNNIYNPNKTINIVENIENSSLNVDRAMHIGLIVNELVCNAFKYAFPTNQAGIIEIALLNNEYDSNSLLLKVRDNGIGLPIEFINDFETQTMGIQLVRTLVKQIKGRITIYNDWGAVFEVSF